MLRVCTPIFTSAHSAQKGGAVCSLCTLCTRVFECAQPENPWRARICALVHSVHSKNREGGGGMTLDSFFQATTAPAPAIRPSRPSPEKKVGRPQTVAPVGLSHSSQSSQSKNMREWAERDTPAAVSPSSPPPPPVDVENEYANFMPPAPPLQCFACSCWQKVPGLAWWCGRCVVTGRKINMRSRCDRGLEEWQASPLQERTAPQPGARRAHCD